jgi:hypothetical protein
MPYLTEPLEGLPHGLNNILSWTIIAAGIFGDCGTPLAIEGMVNLSITLI